MLIIFFSVVIFSGWPAIYKAKRIGKGGRQFTIFKFRTMINESKRGKFGLSDEDYVTPIGKILRKTHFDETLQLFNVLMGDMTLIGPRAMDLERFKYLYAKNNDWKKIMKSIPGITGINQLCKYHPKTSKRILKSLKLKKRNRLFLDDYYIHNRSFILDLKIALWTFIYLTETFEGVVISYSKQFFYSLILIIFKH